MDEELKNDCADNGDYCKFNERFLALLSNLESQEWFSKYEIPGEFEFTYNEEFGEFEKVAKTAQFYEVDFMKEIVLEELRGIEESRTDSSNTVPSLLLDKLESVDFTQIYSYLLEPEEEEPQPGVGGGGGGGGGKGGKGRRKRGTNEYFLRRRKKREGPGHSPGPGGGGFFGEEREPVSYTGILNNVKRFIAAADKILKSALSNKRKKRQAGTRALKLKCDIIGSMLYTLAMKSGVKDGSQYSFAKIKNSGWLNHLLGELEAVADTSSFSHCGAEKISNIVEIELQELRKFIEYKEFDDGFSQRMR